MGEIEGIHHGTYREGMWWWNARGYSSAAAETWNCIRALDYLETRPEVDKERFGVTGRSGGGAYSWWISAIDERIKVAVPVAGITSLRNHVVDGCVEGHCDCMYPVNTYRWDFPMIAALVAPRPLLISNTDKDTIFPLDGVYEVHKKTRKIYQLLGAEDKLGLQITEGPHKDTQVLRVHAFAWFDRFLKGIDPPPLIGKPAVPFLTPQQLKVLDAIPSDERTSTIHETFAAQAPAPVVPETEVQWQVMQVQWTRALRDKVFRGWPEKPGKLSVRLVSEAVVEGIRMRAYEFQGTAGLYLPMIFLEPDEPVTGTVATVVDGEGWRELAGRVRTVFAPQIEQLGGQLPTPDEDSDGYGRLAAALKESKVRQIFLVPRGIGPTAWSDDARERVHIRRRFMLLGQTLDGMRVWDIKRGLEAANTVASDVPHGSVHARGIMAANALYASLFVQGTRWTNLLLTELPASHADGPDYLNVLRYLDIPAALAMASEREPSLCRTKTQEWLTTLRKFARLLETSDGPGENPIPESYCENESASRPIAHTGSGCYRFAHSSARNALSLAALRRIWPRWTTLGAPHPKLLIHWRDVTSHGQSASQRLPTSVETPCPPSRYMLEPTAVSSSIVVQASLCWRKAQMLNFLTLFASALPARSVTASRPARQRFGPRTGLFRQPASAAQA